MSGDDVFGVWLQELMASLETQKKSSLSSRFRRRQRTLEEQEENDRKWKRIQVNDIITQ